VADYLHDSSEQNRSRSGFTKNLPLKDTVGEFHRVSLIGINLCYHSPTMTTFTAMEAAYVVARTI
jgi:hypothetical protein